MKTYILALTLTMTVSTQALQRGFCERKSVILCSLLERADTRAQIGRKNFIIKLISKQGQKKSHEDSRTPSPATDIPQSKSRPSSPITDVTSKSIVSASTSSASTASASSTPSVWISATFGTKLQEALPSFPLHLLTLIDEYALQGTFIEAFSMPPLTALAVSSTEKHLLSKLNNTLKKHFSNNNSFTRLLILPDDRLITGYNDGIIILWDILPASQVPLYQKQMKVHNSAITALALLPNGYIASGSERDGIVKVWNLNDGTQRMEIPGIWIQDHWAQVNQILTLPNGQLAIIYNESDTAADQQVMAFFS